MDAMLTTSRMSHLTRRLIQCSGLALLGFLVIGSPAQADEASCNAIIAMQQAYCEGRGTPLPDGQSYGYYESANDSCVLRGC